MKLKHLIFIIFILCGKSVTAQIANEQEFQDKLNTLFQHIINAQNDEQRIAINDTVTTLLHSMAEADPQWNISFDSIRYVGRIIASDKNIALYSWVVPLDSSTIYNAIFQHIDSNIQVLKTISSTETISENQIYTAQTWYGALYYGLIPFKVNKTTHYALLGWRNTLSENQKIIDIISFEGEELALGMPLFEHTKTDSYTGKARTTTKTRAIFAFDSRVSMYLEYNAQKRRIEFDNLSPMVVIDGQIISYGPDFSMNAYRLKHGKWLFEEDIKVKGKKRRNM